MEKDKMRGLMIDHIDGNLSGELSSYVEAHISKNPEAKKEYEQLQEVLQVMAGEEELSVPEEGKSDFMKMLEDQKADLQKEGKQVPLINAKAWYSIAAAVALLFLGYVGGKMLSNSEIDDLRNEMQETRQLVMMSMLNEQSASERMKGVLSSQEIEVADDQILDALIQTMNSDDNINVRIAAVEALGNFADNQRVREALVQSLSQQEYPAVQLKLIALMVDLGEKKAIAPLQKMIDNEEIISTVKDEAQFGIFKLM